MGTFADFVKKTSIPQERKRAGLYIRVEGLNLCINKFREQSPFSYSP
jgi:hypothetical protein